MKSLTEIKERIERQLKDPGEGFMIAACNHQHPLQVYHPEYIKEGYEADPLTEEAIIKEMRDYMDFALGKARNERGISANRSIWKYVQWLWALDDEELLAFAEDDDNYPMYGMPILQKICDKYGFKEAET